MTKVDVSKYNKEGDDFYNTEKVKKTSRTAYIYSYHLKKENKKAAEALEKFIDEE